jgi:hypothetical protein
VVADGDGHEEEVVVDLGGVLARDHDRVFHGGVMRVAEVAEGGNGVGRRGLEPAVAPELHRLRARLERFEVDLLLQDQGQLWSSTSCMLAPSMSSYGCSLCAMGSEDSSNTCTLRSCCAQARAVEINVATSKEHLLPHGRESAPRRPPRAA